MMVRTVWDIYGANIYVSLCLIDINITQKNKLPSSLSVMSEETFEGPCDVKLWAPVPFRSVADAINSALH